MELYMVIPLDLTDEQIQVYKILYKEADFNTMFTKFTVEQIVLKSNKLFCLTDQKVRTILKKFEERGYIKIIERGRKGKFSVCKINKINEINQQLTNNCLTADQQLTNNNDSAVSTLLSVNQQLTNNCLTADQQLTNNLFKDKDKDKDNINELNQKIEKIRSHFKGTKSKSNAYKKLPKLIKEHGVEKLINSINCYNDYVNKERSNGFKELKYVNESTFWNGRFIDYLDPENTEIKTQKKKIEIVYRQEG